MITTSRKKGKAIVAPKSRKGVLTLAKSKNNTILTLVDNNTNRLIQTISAGSCGFKGSQRSTKFACETVAKEISILAEKENITEIIFKAKEIQHGRDSIIKEFIKRNIEISSIVYDISVPFGGCRPKKARRM